MMEIYVVRHGIAVAREEDLSDAFRPLTGKGRRRFRKTAKAFARLGRKLDLILTSPLVRAVQTAEILAGATKHGEVAVLEELDPNFGVDSLLDALAERANGSRSVALVGHEPQLSSLVGALAGVPAEDVDLKKGAIVRLDVPDVSQPGAADARWTLNPRSKSVAKGLPLTEADERSAERRGGADASAANNESVDAAGEGDTQSEGSAGSPSSDRPSDSEPRPQPS